ncbi:hypothetical protein [Paenibacillus spongiae]|uniref:DUF2757 family protein n=1 Tax=Paenibacillus spongiae TaxID=2909671 RepID=A0ABY5SII5_9BACL|nr:hypothetical protein [Paenibacillus spongiae]UVI32068.1 hypothetical protein L1F29_09725 [Paenibacillus spongiae]
MTEKGIRVTIACESCGHFVDLIPLTKGQHANISKIEGDFRIEEIDLDYDYSVDAVEEVTAEVKEMRIDCQKCNNYIVLNEFPSHVY